ncbi:MAG: hypothetical protein ACM3YM_00055, partial [Sphingomonadales bacterium]
PALPAGGAAHGPVGSGARSEMLGVVRLTSGALAVLFAAITFLVSIIPCPHNAPSPRGEIFSPELVRIDSVDKAEIWVRARLDGRHASDAQIADAITLFAERRFYHGLSRFRVCDDWIANLAGMAWVDLSSPVMPDDILKYRRAICSQQTMVVQALLARFGIPFATIGIDKPGHMMAAARINGVWAAYDSNLEPHRTGIVPFAALERGSTWKQLYAGKPGVPEMGPGDLGDQFSRAADHGLVTLTAIDQYPAARAATFQRATHFFSRYGWMVFALVFLLTWARLPSLAALVERPRQPRTGTGWPRWSGNMSGSMPFLARGPHW